MRVVKQRRVATRRLHGTLPRSLERRGQIPPFCDCLPRPTRPTIVLPGDTMKRRTREEEKLAKRRQRAAASLAALPKSYALRDMPGILPFQRSWLDAAFADGVDLAALSAARGSGKSCLAGWVAACAVAPQGALHEPAGAILIVAPTTSQGREVFLAARRFLEGVEDLRWRDSASGIGVRHLPTAAECRILAASSKSLLGYGANSTTIVFDEVAAGGAKGRAVFDSLITSLGKRPGQRVIALGTRSPSGPGDWWPRWLDSTEGKPRTHVQVLEGDADNWRAHGEAVRANPLASSEPLASVLGRERAEAETDPAALARYRAYRLNHASDPTAARVFSEAELLMVSARPVPPRQGQPVVSIDTGGLLSWSASCAIWPDSGRIELWAVAPPGVAVALTESDGLFVMSNQVPPVAVMLARVADFPEPPSLVVGDPHRFAELQEWARSRGVRCALRGGRSSNLVGDVQAARRLLLDDGAAFALGAPLLQLAAGEVTLTGDGRGLRKSGQGRDDPLRALLLCAGAAQPQGPPLPALVYVQPPAW